MGYHLRVEVTDVPQLLTFRTLHSAIWFENNPKVRDRIGASLAKYSTVHGVILYGAAIMGDHIQLLACFPNGNRADFVRDVKAEIARMVKRLVPEFPGGPLWERRYSCEFLPNHEDLEHYFFYLALNPVHHGLVERISQYADKSCSDAIYGRKRKYKVLKVGTYLNMKRYNPHLREKDFEKEYTLEFARLPGHERKSHKEYVKYMLSRLEQRRQEILEERKADGKKGFMGPEKIARIRPGTRAKKPKKSKRNARRPVVLSLCKETKEKVLEWYFSVWFAFERASERYRAGERRVKFPEGTYPPWLPSRATTCTVLA